MTKKMKVLWLCSWYPNKTYTTSGSFIRRQLKAVQPFCELGVMFVVETKDAEKWGVDKHDDEGVLTLIGYIQSTSFLPLKLFYFLKTYVKLYKLLLKNWGKPDLVHLNIVYPAGFFALILNIFQKIPFIISEHSSLYRPERNLYNGVFLKKLTHFCVKKAKSVIALTDFNVRIMRELRNLKNNNYLVIPNVVDTKLFTPAQNTETPKRTFTFLHISGLHDSIKNVSGILRSIGQLSLIRQDFRFQIIGDIEECPPYFLLAEDLNILHRFVTFSPEIPYKKVAEIMQNVDAFVLFSHVEGLPCVILEAMSASLPVIATETGGISEWVTPETGILLSIGDETRLVEAMDYMIDNHHKYAPSVIRSRIVEKCSIDAVGHSILNVYKDVLKL